MVFNRNRMIGAGLGALVFGMVGMAYAAVPLYRAFCAATGYDGTPQIGPAGPTASSNRVITIALNATTNPNLPWSFKPEQPKVSMKLGEEQMAFFDAKNLSSTAIEGVALYNVTPDTVGRYFHKTQCFCFNAQTLQPGEAVQMPVTFWVDPAIANDPDTRDVKTITLSYTFFRSLKDAEKTGQLAKAGPHTGNTGPVKVLSPGTAAGAAG